MLQATEGQHDDRAVAFVLGLKGRANVLCYVSVTPRGPCLLVPRKDVGPDGISFRSW